MVEGMKEHVVYLESLPTIPDQDCCADCKTTARQFWNVYQTWIILCAIVMIIGGIVITVIMTSKSYSYPCMVYTPETLASSVSVECLQYMWNVNCATRSPYTFPADYQGWWNRSPQGGTTVRCSSNPQCGVGSYNGIITYMSFCNINPP
jgi:hypothetical protein